MKICNLYKTALLFLLFQLTVLAQENMQLGTIKGRLLDQETKEVLVGANVEILNALRGAATDVNGEFIINNVKVDSYVLKFSYVGYQSVTKTDILVRPGDRQ